MIRTIIKISLCSLVWAGVSSADEAKSLFNGKDLSGWKVKIKGHEAQVKKFDSVTKRMSIIADAMADDDKLEVELLKLLDENGVTDEVIRGRAIEITRQINEEARADNRDYRALWNS